MAYVDDLKCATANLPLFTSVKAALNNAFDVRDLGPASYFLGMEIDRDRSTRTLKLTQQKATKEIIEKYGVLTGKPKSTPLSPSVHLVPATEDEILDPTEFPYSELVGKLLYLSNCTRPDIAHVVGQLCRYMSQPGVAHWNAALGVVKYLAATPNVGIVFSPTPSLVTTGFCDSDYAGDLHTRRSTTGYVFLLGGGAVSWSSRLQHTVAVSTAEAEYMAAAAAVKEALWLRQLLVEFKIIMHTVPISCDNQAAISLLTNPISSQRSKHIDILYHFARQRVERKEVSFHYVHSHGNVVDALTKALSPHLFANCKQSMGLA
jgi:hypothetical protein